MLIKKEERIKQKKIALTKYKNYLDSIRDAHSEQFDDVKKITERYQVLVSENDKLHNRIESLDSELKELKDNTNRYLKEKSIQNMKLNNELNLKKSELERINDEKNKLKSEAEEHNRKKFGKYAELAQILMAINDIQIKQDNRAMEQRKIKSKNVI